MSSEDLFELCDDDHLWVCFACGKTSRSKSGTAGDDWVAMPGWDVSCMMHSKCMPKADLVYNEDGQVCEVK